MLKLSFNHPIHGVIDIELVIDPKGTQDNTFRSLKTKSLININITEDELSSGIAAAFNSQRIPASALSLLPELAKRNVLVSSFTPDPLGTAKNAEISLHFFPELEADQLRIIERVFHPTDDFLELEAKALAEQQRRDEEVRRQQEEQARLAREEAERQAEAERLRKLALQRSFNTNPFIITFSGIELRFFKHEAPNTVYTKISPKLYKLLPETITNDFWEQFNKQYPGLLSADDILVNAASDGTVVVTFKKDFGENQPLVDLAFRHDEPSKFSSDTPHPQSCQWFYDEWSKQSLQVAITHSKLAALQKQIVNDASFIFEAIGKLSLPPEEAQHMLAVLSDYLSVLLAFQEEASNLQISYNTMGYGVTDENPAYVTKKIEALQRNYETTATILVSLFNGDHAVKQLDEPERASLLAKIHGLNEAFANNHSLLGKIAVFFGRLLTFLGVDATTTLGGAYLGGLFGGTVTLPAVAIPVIGVAIPPIATTIGALIGGGAGALLGAGVGGVAAKQGISKALTSFGIYTPTENALARFESCAKEHLKAPATETPSAIPTAAVA